MSGVLYGQQLTFPGDFPNGDLRKGELMKKESFLCGDENTDPGGVVPVGFTGEDGNSIKAAIAAASSDKYSLKYIRKKSSG